MKKRKEQAADLENLEKKFKDLFDSSDFAREEGLKLSRQIGRVAAQAIKKMHQGDFNASYALLEEGITTLKKAKTILADFPEIRFAGFLHNGEKELLEGLVTYSILKDRMIFIPDFKVFDKISYLHGLAESIGEVRRYILDSIRREDFSNVEELLDMMDDIYYFLLSFDYQESLTRGLRRSVDMMRGLLERTRSEVTLVTQQKNLEKKLSGK